MCVFFSNFDVFEFTDCVRGTQLARFNESNGLIYVHASKSVAMSARSISKPQRIR